MASMKPACEPFSYAKPLRSGREIPAGMPSSEPATCWEGLREGLRISLGISYGAGFTVYPSEPPTRSYCEFTTFETIAIN